jgi:hypothetical protein
MHLSRLLGLGPRCDSTGVAPLSKGGTTMAVVWKRSTFSTTSLHQFSLRRTQPFPDLDQIESLGFDFMSLFNIVLTL